MILAAGLTACGFRLQGVGGYPEAMSKTYISTNDRYTPFFLKLRDSLEKGGIAVVDSPIDASAVIRIEQDESDTRVLTISGRKVPREIDVRYRVRYSVTIDGTQAIPSRGLSRRQDITFDPDTVLGKKREENNVRDALAASLVQQVNRELSVL